MIKILFSVAFTLNFLHQFSVFFRKSAETQSPLLKKKKVPLLNQIIRTTLIKRLYSHPHKKTHNQEGNLEEKINWNKDPTAQISFPLRITQKERENN